MKSDRTCTESFSSAFDFAKASNSQAVQQLQEFVRIPSVSSDPKKARDVKRCAKWLAQHLHTIGLHRVRVLPTARHPIVYGEWLGAAGKPTILIYGHYDVQPAEPESEWKVPPFAGIVRDGFIYGRGASDDKGQLFAHIKAIEALLRTTRHLPVNVKCLFEGEEEIGSPNLLPFIRRNRRALQADAVVMSDTRMLSQDQPALTYALRGQLAMELEVHGPDHDLHSGNFGGAVHDPLQALCEVIARLHDSTGHIAVPGFYGKVRCWNSGERKYLAQTGPSDADILHEAGASTAWGEQGYSLYERVTLRPSLAITGMRGGHGGVGPKGVIPCQAIAKLSFRLVPDQEPAEIEQLVRRYIERITPSTIRIRIKTHTYSRPVLLDRKNPVMRAAAAAYRRVFGRTPVWLRSGGTIPVVSQFQDVLRVPIVLMGFASPGDNLHGQNERFSVKNFHRGILTCIAFLEEFGRTLPARRQQNLKPVEVQYDH